MDERKIVIIEDSRVPWGVVFCVEGKAPTEVRVANLATLGAEGVLREIAQHAGFHYTELERASAEPTSDGPTTGHDEEPPAWFRKFILPYIALATAARAFVRSGNRAVTALGIKDEFVFSGDELRRFNEAIARVGS